MKTMGLVWLAALVLLGAASRCLASGGDRGGGVGGGFRGGGASAAGPSLNDGVREARKYELGKDTLFGVVPLPDQPRSPELAEEQAAELTALREDLIKSGAPKFVVAQLDVERFAGRLDDRQMEALKYFLTSSYQKRR